MGQIRSSGDIRSRVVVERLDVPEWGEGAFLYTKNLTAREHERWQLSLMGQGKGGASASVMKERLKSSNARLVILGACDENGESIFADDDIAFLMDQDAKGLARVADAITVRSALGDEDEAVEELTGNSAASRTSSSNTGWQPTSDS